MATRRPRAMQYFRQLDALRFYSVFWVILSHTGAFDVPKKITVFFSYLQGLPIFFCISGFLISTIVLTNRAGSSRNFFETFYIRRFLRIFPIYYLTIFFLFLFNPENYRNTWLVFDLTYLSNIKLGLEGNFDANPVTPHFWSLAVEEQFYLVWPAALFFSHKKLQGFVPGILFFLIGLAATFFFGSFFTDRTFGAISHLGGGCLLALLMHYKKEKMIAFEGISNMLFMLLIASLAIFSIMDIQVTGILLACISIIGIPVVLLKFLNGFTSRAAVAIVENKYVLYLGKISYGLYVYHMMAIYPLLAIERLTGFKILDNPQMAATLKVLITIAVSILSWEFFEKRINNLKNRFEYTH